MEVHLPSRRAQSHAKHEQKIYCAHGGASSKPSSATSEAARAENLLRPWRFDDLKTVLSGSGSGCAFNFVALLTSFSYWESRRCRIFVISKYTDFGRSICSVPRRPFEVSVHPMSLSHAQAAPTAGPSASADCCVAGHTGSDRRSFLLALSEECENKMLSLDSLD
jgi:hypothetical protein